MKKNYLNSIMLLLVIFGISNLIHAQIITDGTYKILNTVNSEVVSINTLPIGDPNNPDGLIVGRARMATPDSADNLQLWSFVHQGNDVYKITNVGDNTILGIKDGWCGDFGDVQVGFDATSPYTLFKIVSSVEPNSYSFQIAFDNDCNFGSVNSPIKAFDIDGGNSNGKLQTFATDTANLNQQFQIVDPASLSLEYSNLLDTVELTYHKEARNLMISYSKNTNLSKIQVIDMNGKIIRTIQGNFKYTVQIECSEFTNGFYFIAIENKGSRMVEKVIIH